MTTIHETITNSKIQLDKLLSNRYIEDSLLLGSLSFTQNKINNFISQNLSLLLDQQSEQVDSDYNSNELIDKLWLEFHYPVIKYFQAHLNSTKNSQKTKHVELRRLFDNFHKFIKTFSDFYTALIKKLLNSYDLSAYIPTKIIYEKFSISDSNQISLDDLGNLASSIVYLIHKSILSLADLSRYRSMVARNFLSLKSITKKDQDFSVAIDHYKLCILILPSFGDPFDHIAIIDNIRNDKFNVVYNFLRSSMTRIPSSLGFSNLVRLLAIEHKENSILKEYREISTIDDPDKINTLELIKLQFLCLFNYFFLPEFWKAKDGKLINGVTVKDLESAFFDNLADCNFNKRPVYSEILFKQLTMLMSGFHILTDKTNSFENDKLQKDSKIIGTYLKFFFKFIKNTFQIILDNWKQHATDKLDLPLIPVFRLILNWLKYCKLGFQYLRYNTSVLYLFCELLNYEYRYISGNSDIILGSLSQSNPDLDARDVKLILSTKFKRARFFKEDIVLKEFAPLGNHLTDFEDDYLFKQSRVNCLRLIGKLPQDEFDNHTSSKIVESALRLLATARLGKMIVTTSVKNTDIGLKYNLQAFSFEFGNDKSKPKSQKEQKKKNIQEQPKKANDKMKTSSITKSNDKTLERIQQTIKQYQQTHPQNNDILSMIKNSHADSVSPISNISPEPSNSKKESTDLLYMIKDSSTTPEQEEEEEDGDDGMDYSNMVSSLINDHDNGGYQQSPTVSDHNNEPPVQTIPDTNIWNMPSPQPSLFQQFSSLNNFQQQQQFEPFANQINHQRQFFGQGISQFVPQPPPPPPQLQQPQPSNNNYSQYFGGGPLPIVNPPIPQVYQQYPPYFAGSPAPQQQQQQQQQQDRYHVNQYPQYGL